MLGESKYHEYRLVFFAYAHSLCGKDGGTEADFATDYYGYRIKLNEIRVSDAGLPDLVPHNLKTDPGEFKPGDYIDVELDVHNEGNADAVAEYPRANIHTSLY